MDSPPPSTQLIPLPLRQAEGLGGKGEGLNRLLQLRFPVPPAEVIPVGCFEAHLSGGEVLPVNSGLRSQLAEVLGRLGPVVAVRSSGLGEDSGTSSFAGQHDTVLNVSGLEALCSAVEQCWRSAFSDRARKYREARGLPGPPKMAVVVQRQLRPVCAGVLFTQSPRDARSLELEAVRGLGDALVSGRAQPERIVVDRTNRRVTTRGGSSREVVTANVLSRLVDLGLEAEAKLGGPQDIEWAADENGVWLLQTRPITTPVRALLGAAGAARLAWTDTNARELFPGLATPMSFALLEGYVGPLLGTMVGQLGVDLTGVPIIGLVGGRVYFCLNTFVALTRVIPGFTRSPEQLFGGQADAIRAALEVTDEVNRPVLKPSRLRALLRIPRLLWMTLTAPEVSEAALVASTSVGQSISGTGLSRASDELVLAQFDATRSLDESSVRVFTPAMLSGMAAVGVTQLLARRWLADADGSRVNSLLTGVGGLDSAEAAQELWALSEGIRGTPVATVLARPLPWVALSARLSETEAGREFLERWARWMERHGHHARSEIDVAQPRWRERPEQVLDTVRAWLSADTVARDDPGAARRAAEERVLAELGPIRRRVFFAALRRAQRGVRLRENMKSAAVRRVALCREAVLELGRRLVTRRLLSRAQDVFFLNPAEVRAAVVASAEGRVESRFREQVELSRRELERWEGVTPPPVVVGEFDPRHGVLPKPPSDATVLTGLAVSAGVAEGLARVVLADDEEARVLPGEILVAPFTDPGWAPYFVAAAALVVDMGGMLSHGSIIAREYGIPAVVNVGEATRRIRTGMRLRVDGFRGEVVILEQ